MLRSVKNLFDYSIEATDGNIGNVYDFYFDDEDWIIRYMIADTGGWFSGRKVLISLSAFSGSPDWEKKKFPVNLTKEKIKNSPDVDTEKPVSREMETEVLKYYNWPPYWTEPYATGWVAPTPIPLVNEKTNKTEEDIDKKSHLRSIREVTGYYIKAKDKEIGEVADFIADDDAWDIRYMVVDTGTWLPGKKVLIAPLWIENVSWTKHTVAVNMTSMEVSESPSYDPDYPVNREYEEVLYDYYGRPKYWRHENRI
jgi:hypothetical protein